MASTTNLYHYKKFLPLEELGQKLRRKQLTVSVVVPALNEEGRIGKVVRSIQKELIQEVPLIDELVVIDGDSSDHTRDEAESSGAKVFSVGDIPPRECPLGKGAALWKSQFVTTGDIVVFVDADIVNFDPRFVYGLIGPFLENDRVNFAKAYYRRPFAVGGECLENYGGRVTEILVRPLLASFVPELAGIFQPLSGEYAFRRTCMETLPFSSGYGVEIGLLLDIFSRFGLEGIAQVDMGTRTHRNRPVDELGRMSFAILHTVFRKLQEENCLTLHRQMAQSMVCLGENGWDHADIREVELPPACEYSTGSSLE